MKNISFKSVCVILIILTVFASVTGCDFLTNIIKDNSDDANNQSTNKYQSFGLKSGFSDSGGCEASPFLCAYKSDKTEFDINDVTLDFYYGVFFLEDEEYERENTFDIPSFDLFFLNEKGKVLVKHVDENLISEKYKISFIYDENLQVIDTVFNHCETFTVPKEVFVKDKGSITFAIYGTNVREYEPEYRCKVSKVIYYKINGDKVILSNRQFK